MKRLLHLLPVLFVLAALATPVAAQRPQDIVDMAAGALPQMFSSSTPCTAGGPGCEFVQIILAVVERIRPLVAVFATLYIVIAGFRMIILQEDDAVDKGKKIVIACVVGLMMTYLIAPFINAFYGGLGNGPAASISGGNIQGGAAIFHSEIAGVIRWITVIVAAGAVTAIIVAAFFAMTSASGEEGIGRLRKSVVSTVTGLLILVLLVPINYMFGLTGLSYPGVPNPFAATTIVISILNIVISFSALAAVTVIAYAGILMILNLGNTEQVKKGRDLIIRVVAGLVVILVAWMIVNFLFA
jgi:hypothetical protein